MLGNQSVVISYKVFIKEDMFLIRVFLVSRSRQLKRKSCSFHFYGGIY